MIESVFIFSSLRDYTLLIKNEQDKNAIILTNYRIKMIKFKYPIPNSKLSKNISAVLPKYYYF